MGTFLWGFAEYFPEVETLSNHFFDNQDEENGRPVRCGTLFWKPGHRRG